MTTENATASKNEQIKAIVRCAKEIVNLDCKIQNFTEIQDNIRSKYAVEIRVKEAPIPMNEEDQRRALSRGIESQLADLVSTRDALIRKLYIGCKTLFGPNEIESQSPTVHDWMT